MNITPLNHSLTAAAGSGAAQRTADAGRAQHEASARQRQTMVDQMADREAGLGEADQGHGVSERDADGRMLFLPGEGKRTRPKEEAEPAATESPPEERRLVQDPTGQSGNQLDLLG